MSASRIPNCRSTRGLPLLALALSISWLGACSGPDDHSDDPRPGDADTTPGALVIIGGGLSADNEDVYRAILDRRAGDGPLCVIPTAGASPESSMEGAVGRIDRWGGEGTARGLLLHLEEPEAADLPATAEAIRECSGYFFTGGVQSRILDYFLPEGRETPAYAALLERFRSGAVVSGSSAGAAMMSDPMIAGGSSEGAFEHGLALDGDEDGVRIRPGMGFISGATFDQHFLARGRIGRLLIAVAGPSGAEWGAGIDEDTALILEEGRARVAGASGVVMVDGRGVSPVEHPAEVRGLTVELVGPGDEIDLASFSVTPAPDRTPIGAARDAGFDPVGDELFERWAFLHLVQALGADERESWSTELHGYRIELRKLPGFRAVASDVEGVEGTPLGLSVGPFEVNLAPL
ncbi:MAG: cyanophycinase [Gemmatimonadales bacterium]|nr:MAG: cyanophycinase [Gemmatimonadales bacterium]